MIFYASWALNAFSANLSSYPQTNAVAGGTLIPISQPTTGTNFATMNMLVSNLFHYLSPYTGRAFGTNVGIVEMSVPPGVGGNNETNDMLNSSAAYAQQLGISYGGLGYFDLWGSAAPGQGTNAWGEPTSWPGGFNSIGDTHFIDLPWSLGTTTFKWYLTHGPAAASRAHVVTGFSAADQLWWLYGINPYSDTGLTIPMFGTNQGIGTLWGIAADGTHIMDQAAFGLQLITISDGNPQGKTNLAGSYSLLGSGPFPFSISWNAAWPDLAVPWQVPLFTIDTSNFVTSGGPLVSGFPIMSKINSNFVRDLNFNYAVSINQSPLAANQRGAGAGFYVTNGTAYVSNFYGGGFVQAPNGNGYYNAGVGTFDWGAQSGNDDQSTKFNVNTAASFNAEGSAWSYDSGANQRIGFVKVNGQFPMAAAAAGAPYNIAHSSASALQNGGSPGTQTLTVDFTADGHTVTVTNNEQFTAQGGIVPISATLNLNSSTTIFSNTFGFTVHNISAYLLCNTNDVNTGWVVGDKVPLTDLGNNQSVAGMINIFWNGVAGYVSAPQAFVGSEANYTMTKRAGGTDAHPSSFANFTLIISAL